MKEVQTREGVKGYASNDSSELQHCFLWAGEVQVRDALKTHLNKNTETAGEKQPSKLLM